MGKFKGLALGLAAGLAAGVAVYFVLSRRRGKKEVVMPHVECGNVVRFPSPRPPFAEEAQAAGDEA